MKVMYTGMTFDDWVEASRKGLYPTIYPELAAGDMVTFVSSDEATIDGFIEGLLTRYHGETNYAKVEVTLPDDVNLIPDEATFDPETGKHLGFFVKIVVPPESLKLVESWKVGPELVEGIEREHEEYRGGK